MEFVDSFAVMGTGLVGHGTKTSSGKIGLKPSWLPGTALPMPGGRILSILSGSSSKEGVCAG